MLENRFVVEWVKGSQGDEELKYLFQKEKCLRTRYNKYLVTKI